MKSFFLLLTVFASILFISCGKSDPGPNNNTQNTTPKSLRFEFTTNVAADYGIHGTAGTAAFDERVTSLTWSKTITGIRTGTGRDSASLIVTPPVAWENTTNQANVTLKIFVDNVQKATKDMVVLWLDRPAIFEVRTTF